MLAILEGKPGARLAWQTYSLRISMMVTASQFRLQTGRHPVTLTEVLDAGWLTFVPSMGTGKAASIVELPHGQLPPADAVGLRFRPEVDLTLIAMGADGDPATPIISSQEFHSGTFEYWRADYAWSRRVGVLMRADVLRQLNAALALTGQFPESPAAISEITQMYPYRCRWQNAPDPHGIGVFVERDSTGEYVRMTSYPAPGAQQQQWYRWDPSTPWQLSSWPQLQLESRQWEPFGMLVREGTLPDLRPVSTVHEQGRFRLSHGEHFHRFLSELGVLADWHMEQTSRLPTPDWLLRQRWGLHAILDDAGAPATVRPYDQPIEIDPTTRMLSGEYPPGILLSVGVNELRLLYHWDTSYYMGHLSDVQLTPEQRSYLDEMKKKKYMTQLRLPQYRLPGGFAKVSSSAVGLNFEEILAASTSESHELSPELRDELWHVAMLRPEHGLELRYLGMAVSALGQILTEHYGTTATTELVDWPEILLASRLSATGYSELPRNAAVPADAGYVEIAQSPDGHAIRVRCRHPLGLELERYLLLSSEARVQSWDFEGGHRLMHRPEFGALTYEVRYRFRIDFPPTPQLDPAP